MSISAELPLRRRSILGAIDQPKRFLAGDLCPSILSIKMGGLAAANGVTEVWCLACSDETCDFKPVKMERRTPGLYDVSTEPL